MSNIEEDIKRCEKLMLKEKPIISSENIIDRFPVWEES